MQRAIGFYWVKGIDADWFVAEWASDSWWCPGSTQEYKDSHFTHIIEERLSDPNEQESKIGAQIIGHMHMVAELLTALEKISDYKVNAANGLVAFDDIIEIRKIARDAINNIKIKITRSPI